jgi:type I restriction enzyme S subunit
MKDSGVEWIGKIPSHWKVERSKVVFREVNDRHKGSDEELLTVSHITGVTSRSEKDVNMFLAESTEGYKKCKAGDLVINTMWAWMGALGMAPLSGIVSPAYNVYRFRRDGYSPDYYDKMFRIPLFITEINRWSKGIWSSRLRLYPGEFFDIRIPVPPHLEQTKIAEFLRQKISSAEKFVAKTQESITRLREYRTALISAAVTGKIDVRNWGTEIT